MRKIILAVLVSTAMLAVSAGSCDLSNDGAGPEGKVTSRPSYLHLVIDDISKGKITVHVSVYAWTHCKIKDSYPGCKIKY